MDGNIEVMSQMVIYGHMWYRCKAGKICSDLGYIRILWRHRGAAEREKTDFAL